MNILSCISAETVPYVEMLRKIRNHLNPGGKIVIAIENRLGMKYWAGCAEDHNAALDCELKGILIRLPVPELFPKRSWRGCSLKPEV